MGKHTEADLDNMIHYFLDEEVNCPKNPNVCAMLSTTHGRDRIFKAIKYLIFNQGFDDIEAAITHLEIQFDWAE
ncbi:MAG: hypothetical protein WCT77_11380 [Bacteroidota bacterium]